VKTAGPGDRSMIYLSGGGAVGGDTRESFYLPADWISGFPNQTAISASEIRSLMKRIQEKKVLFEGEAL